MATRQQRSFRFDPEILTRLDSRARSTGLTQTALVQRYIEEGLRQELHWGIVFVTEAAGRRARIGGTGLDVWEIVAVVQDNQGSVIEAAEYLAIPERLVRDAMRYYADWPDEIDDWIAENDRYFDEELTRQKKVAEHLA